MGVVDRCSGDPRRAQRRAAEAGITTQQLSDFLAGDRTLRSDVLDRLTAAVGASLIVAQRK